MAIALVTNVITPYRAPLYALLAERYGVEVLCFGAGQSYVPEWFGDLDGQLAAAPFPARRLDGPRAALRLGDRYAAAIAPVAGGAMLPATYAAMRLRRRRFVLWASVWADPRGGAKAAVALPLLHHVCRRADAVLTYGPHVSRYVAGFRHRADDVFVAPQSVDGALFGRAVGEQEIADWRAAHDLPADAPLLLYVGRLVPEKGIATLLGAWRTLHAARPQARLVAIGDGELAPALRAAAGDGVVLLPPVGAEQLPVAYAAATAVTLPSIPTPRFREPWGLVCNEALHQATPVVATGAVGAVAGGLVRDGETGLVVPAGDVPALAAALGRLLDDAPLRARLGEAGRAALAGHTHARQADAFGDALRSAGVI
ncbi:glycosyltransferase family 4 protein [Conexibacter sp. JD483]|uniref:glycosyltransferase family 4 protein n=1 Tax=unclassified Conexibacter TaxID=2627773 RepID=UPI002721B4C1|nr:MULTISPECIES: glycosyltransferase family 4 protein [unclassified Conexibacter]MDO8185950.1 glycosyltransferase family 4 protein [Conexibacter sp. CPCC 205706]MDO8199441.1 glycosyltransferase family 4 protein [Conexibacter sp. CPCC 205762]MDR9368559.1 glycosyltransferase family 4 protein [Conexibacter sp. JD483]